MFLASILVNFTGSRHLTDICSVEAKLAHVSDGQRSNQLIHVGQQNLKQLSSGSRFWLSPVSSMSSEGHRPPASLETDTELLLGQPLFL